MTNIIRPEADAPVDAMKIHKDVIWVIRTLWGGAAAVVLVTAWMVALAADVEQNSKDISAKASQQQLTTMTEILKRVEKKIDNGDDRQREIQQSQARLEQKVEDLEKKVEDIDE